MGEEALVESQIADSVSLVRSLDTQGYKPSAAVWYYFPDAEEWRLLIAGPAFDALLPKEEARAYERVVEALSKTPVDSLSIGQIKVVKTDYPMLTASRFLMKTGPDAIVRAHFRDNNINGIFVKEMLILRAA